MVMVMKPKKEQKKLRKFLKKALNLFILGKQENIVKTFLKKNYQSNKN